jgi:hypothetical protein
MISPATISRRDPLTRECPECDGYGYLTKHDLCDPRGGRVRCDAAGCEDGTVTVMCEAYGCREPATDTFGGGDYCARHLAEVSDGETAASLGTMAGLFGMLRGKL